MKSAVFYLNRLVEVCYWSLELTRGIVTWIEFKEELISNFGDMLVEDVGEEFDKLRLGFAY